MELYALSFFINVLATFIAAGLIYQNATQLGAVLGPDTPARRILASVYATIGLISLYCLAQIVFGKSDIAETIGRVLFPLQIIYKLITVVAIGLKNLLVIANLAVAVLLCVTLALGG